MIKEKKFFGLSIKKTIAVVLAIILLAAFSGLAFYFTKPTNPGLSISDVNKAQVAAFSKNYDKKLIEFSDLLDDIDGFEDKSIDNVKIMKDFNGELYAVVECEPTGYIIYSYQYNKMVECAADSISPYLGVDSGLIYGGPTYYYQESLKRNTAANLYLYDLMAEEELALNAETFDAFKNYNQASANAIQEKVAQEEVLKAQYDRGGIMTTGTEYKSGSWKYLYVDNSSYVSGLTKFGTNSNGTCGYIAAAITLYYAHKQWNSDFVDSSYLVTGGISNQLHLDLVSIGKDLGIGNGTIASDIEKVMKSYCKDRVSDATHFWMLLSTPLNIQLCFEDNKTVIIFGNLVDAANPNGPKVNHAVTAFGRAIYNPNIFVNDRYYDVHYGWSGYTNVRILDSIFQNPIGSIYNLNPAG